MSDMNIDTSWYKVHIAASSCANSALVAYWRTVDKSPVDMFANLAEKNLRDAAALLGYDLVKREEESAMERAVCRIEFVEDR